MTGLLDTHVHLDAFDSPPDVVAQAGKCGVREFVVPGVAPQGWAAILAVAETLPGVWAAPGIHPLAADQWTPEVEQRLRAAARHSRVVAIGEVGLDSRVEIPRHIQEETLRRMIRLAREFNLPLLLHVRQAMGRLLSILHEEEARQTGGIFHAFSGSLETAYQVIELGFALGIGGVVTFPEARRLPEVVRQVPAEFLVLESDAPDLAPHPHRGKRNIPALLPLIARAVAGLRNWSLEETAEITTRNAKKILNLA
jgi:TatD DNase family protein